MPSNLKLEGPHQNNSFGEKMIYHLLLENPNSEYQLNQKKTLACSPVLYFYLWTYTSCYMN